MGSAVAIRLDPDLDTSRNASCWSVTDKAKREVHTTLFRNLARAGLLTERIAPKRQSLGVRVHAGGR
jgi:hypothetical protein